ncbi:hypothetical protein Q8A67_015057 [Cirrhinus molitorella]|uniref:Uncharacterized protein n=1 Tax=Cirrhinus molitorella TaxID=172907 RepID=A0AA88PNY6_9TELE|nr:hypothetical protein Q8A67_015057 [Cirrhinus molitorella]
MFLSRNGSRSPHTNSYFYFSFRITGYRLLNECIECTLRLTAARAFREHHPKETHSKHYLHSFPPLTLEGGVGGATGVALEPHWPLLMSIILEDFGTRGQSVTMK